MAQVTYAKLFSESRANVLTLVSDTSNVSDPLLNSVSFRKWIYSREPDVKASDFQGYPCMIVHPSTVDIAEEGGSVDGKSKVVSWEIEVEVVTSDRGYGENNGQGLSHMDSISDDLMQTFLDMTNRNSLSSDSMNFSRPSTTTVVTEGVAKELVYRRSIMLPFKSRIQVSA